MLCLQLSAGSSLCILHRCLFSFARYYLCWNLEWDGQSTTSVQKVYSRYHERIRIECFRWCVEIDSTALDNKSNDDFNPSPQINPPFKYWFDTHPSFEITRSNEVLLMSSQPQVEFHQQLFDFMSLDADSMAFHVSVTITQRDLCLTCCEEQID